MFIVQRKVYGLLDLLGDLGGLASSLKALFSVAIGIFQYKAAVTYVANHTFLIRDGDEKEKRTNVIEVNTNKKWKRLPIGFIQSIKLSLHRVFDSIFCGCCRRC